MISSVSLTRTSRPLVLAAAVPERGVNSNHFGGQADNPGEILVAEFAGHGPENAGAARVRLVVDNDHRVGVEADVAAVVAAGGPFDADDHALDHVALFHFRAGDRLLD